MFAGLGLGWLVALSRSSILATVVPALFTAIVGSLPLLEVARKTPEAERSSGSSILVLGVMIVCVAVGSSLGARAVAQAWFAPRPDAYQALAGTLSDEAVRKKYLEGMVGALSAEKAIAPPLQAGEITGIASSQCLQVRPMVLKADALDDDVLGAVKKAAKGDAGLEAILARQMSRTELAQRILDYCR